jgi:hypothetical protein
MKKIKKALIDNGYKVEFKGTYSRSQYRSKYNCLEDVYTITKDSLEFELTAKITGKKLYMMNQNNNNSFKLIAGGESEKSFIEMFNYYLKK